MKIGDMVIIKECHKMPQLVGLEAKVIAQADPDYTPYPFQVVLTGDPIKVTIHTPFGEGEGESKGPFHFREDELELAKPPPEIPQAFQDMDKPS